MLNKKIKSVLFLTAYSCVSMAADGDEGGVNKAPQAADSNSSIQLDEIEVKAKRRRFITPLPGVPIDKATATTNIQSATAKEIEESKALNVTDFMNSSMQSVTVNDYTGNPFQQDLNFRGFTASPQIGTPQGISVYLDGVRVNEAFGDVVNWDLIPMNAVESLNMIPGSNPMFGLNTLGGALAIRTKDGFSDNYFRSQYLSGSWGREQMQLSNGINNGTFALFTAYNHFNEDGWRDNSPSNLRQLFNKATIRLDKGEINFSALNVDTDLVGNGMLPYEMAEQDRKQVFTSPDQMKNSLEHYNFSGSWYVNDTLTLSAMAYKRKMNQSAVGADVYDAYYAAQQVWDPINYPGADKVNGIFNYSALAQKSDGFTLQAAWDLEKHQIVAGASMDSNNIRFLQSQLMGEINESHEVTPVTNPVFDPVYDFAVFRKVLRNNLTGSSRTKSIFLFDTWSPTDSVHVSLGGRFNWTNVKNYLEAEVGKDPYNYDDGDLTRLRCKLPGESATTAGLFVCTHGDYDYRSFNPSVGVTWDLKENVSAYTNISRGARTPTVIELGCANDKTKDNTVGSTNYQQGCSIPTSLSADPYLKQVRSTAYELGLRGGDNSLDWNIGLFRTDLTDDILFVPLGRKNRGVFDNFGATMRQGLEMGIKWAGGDDKLSLNYTLMKATFESPARLVNPANSSNTQNSNGVNAQAYVDIKPGDELPGMPNHIVQANWNHRFTDKLDATLSMVMHSSSYVRGNENNQHEPRVKEGIEYYDYIGKGSTPGYAVFNLRVNYKITQGINMFLKLDNVFDREYSTAGNLALSPFNAAGQFMTGTVQSASEWNNTTFIGLGAPRAAWIGISMDLNWKNKSFKD
jgi:iron complex outermembrane recepter protein